MPRTSKSSACSTGRPRAPTSPNGWAQFRDRRPVVVRFSDLAAGARPRHVAALDAAALLAIRQRPGHKSRRLSQAGRENHEIRNRLFRFGQQVKLGVPWLWDGVNQFPRRVTWDFEQLTPDPAIDAGQIRGLCLAAATGFGPALDHDRAAAAPGRINAKAASTSSTPGPPIRCADSSPPKQHGVDAIIVSQPFNDKNGLMRRTACRPNCCFPGGPLPRCSAAQIPRLGSTAGRQRESKFPSPGWTGRDGRLECASQKTRDAVPRQ